MPESLQADSNALRLFQALTLQAWGFGLSYGVLSLSLVHVKVFFGSHFCKANF